MKTLIVYDSVFGNTEQVALAIGNTLGSQPDVEVLRVEHVKPEQLAALRLFIVGSPTRAFRPTPAISRLLGRIPANGLGGVKVAAFDTRISMEDTHSRFLRLLARLFGYAAKPISVQLKRRGGELTVPPEGFFVRGTEGPLKEGEIERAAEWARRIAAAIQAA